MSNDHIAQDGNIMSRMNGMKTLLKRVYVMLDSITKKTPYEEKLMADIEPYIDQE